MRLLLVAMTGAAFALSIVALVGLATCSGGAPDNARFAMIEARQASFGAALKREIVARQQARGDAQLSLAGESLFAGGHWRKIGEWSEHEKTKALAVYRGELVTGLLGHPAQVWAYDGTDWRLLGEWPEQSYVSVLRSVGNVLYAGVGGEIWAYDDAWSKVGETDGNAYSMSYHDGALFVGVTGSRDDLVLRYANGKWSLDLRCADEPCRYTGAYELHVHDGQLYAGMMAAYDTSVVLRRDQGKWVKVGGDGLNGSWTNTAPPYVLSMASTDGKLIVSMNRWPQIQGLFSTVWAFDGMEWHPVGASVAPPEWGNTGNFNALATFGGRLQVSAGGHPKGHASLWEYDGMNFRRVAGRGEYESWNGALAKEAVAEYIYRLVEWRGTLVAGFGDGPGMAQVWQYTPHKQVQDAPFLTGGASDGHLASPP